MASSNQSESFEEVLRAAADGRPWAFEYLWHNLHPPLKRYLRVAASEAAEDLASETWLQVARDMGRFRGDERAFRRWFFTIARHVVIDQRRKERRRPGPVQDERDRPDPADPLEETLSTEAALAIIATLPKDQADAVSLRVVAGLSVEDAARVMGKRAGTVRVLTHRGLRALAEKLSSGPL
ncbi:MAG: RNA polymerase sigma factor [Actinomycetota bacterium]|nr:RNA polymerase sigma factor [Actinomycetota bacterium]